jgi:hypothetical protein
VEGGAAFGIVAGTDEAFGLVDRKVEFALGFNRSAIDGDMVGVGINLGAELGDSLAVDRDAAGGNDLLGGAPGSDAGIRQEFLEADLHNGRESGKGPASRGYVGSERFLGVGLGFAKADHAVAFFPLATAFEDGNAFKAFENVAFGAEGAGAAKAGMLSHKIM